MSTPRPGPFPGPRPTPFGAPQPGSVPRPPVPGQAGAPQPGPRPTLPVPGPVGTPVQGGTAGEMVARVEAAVAGLTELDGLPVAAHVARYDALHGELSEALAAIDGV